MRNQLTTASKDAVLLAIGEAAHYAPVGTGWSCKDLPDLADALRQKQAEACALHPQLDFSVVDHGTIQLLTPLTTDAEEWVEHHLPDDAATLGPAIAVEHRYIEPILIGIERNGLSVAYTGGR